MRYTVVIYSENKPGVLYRVADMFLRRKINIDSLTVAPSVRPGLSRFSVVIDITPEKIQAFIKKLQTVIEIVEANAFTDDMILAVDTCVAKATWKTAAEKETIIKLIENMRAHILEETDSFAIFSITSTEEDIDKLQDLLLESQHIELIRSGRLAIKK